MAINPHQSPWLKPKRIYDRKLYWRWSSIAKHLTSKPTYTENYDQLWINEQFVIAKNSYKFRPISHLDWAFYNGRELAEAIDQGRVLEYYEQQLKDSRSDPNVWQDKPKEMSMKSYYAWRKGRASVVDPQVFVDNNHDV